MQAKSVTQLLTMLYHAAADDVSPSTTKKRKAPEVTATKQLKVKADKKEKSAPAKAAKKTRREAEDKENDNANDDGDEEEEDDSTKALVAQIDDAASDAISDDEAGGGASLFQPGQDVGKAPAAAVVAAQNKKVKATGKSAITANGEEMGGVIYVGRIPHGFFEHEMRSYFSQFGDIKRLGLSRNRKTGASKHYAFIEFVDRDVADIVAKTMDNYLLFGHLLRCTVVAHERIPPNLFKGANRRFKAVPWNRIAGRRLGEPKSEADWADKINREQSRRAQRAAKLASTMGYSFAGPALKSVDTAKALPPAEADAAEDKEDKKEEEPPKQLEPAAAENDGAAEGEAAPTEAKAAKSKKGKAKKSKA